MKKTQWQFTHRPDNQADIKRILREAREDGLTCVEVKGGPHAHRGVYLDARFIEKHKEYWPKGEIEYDAIKPHESRDGWTGNYVFFAPSAKRAHEQFCKNLEAASKPRAYPPTVSVRAAGPELERYIPKVGDWFTAKAINGGALRQIAEDPHGQTLICLKDLGELLRIKFFGESGDFSWTITKAYYEFRQREKL